MSEKGRWDGLPVLILGSSGTAIAMSRIIERINFLSGNSTFKLYGYCEKETNDIGKKVFADYKVVVSDVEIEDYSKKLGILGAILSFGIPLMRRRLAESLLTKENILFPNIIDPDNQLGFSEYIHGIGNVIYGGINTDPGVSIGSFSLINKSVILGHDVSIGDFCVINPGATVGGNVEIENEVLIGSGAVILQNLRIGKGSTIGSGAVVTKDVAPGETVVGVPAKRVAEAK